MERFYVLVLDLVRTLIWLALSWASLCFYSKGLSCNSVCIYVDVLRAHRIRSYTNYCRIYSVA
jgi:hypothetical protein